MGVVYNILQYGLTASRLCSPVHSKQGRGKMINIYKTNCYTSILVKLINLTKWALVKIDGRVLIGKKIFFLIFCSII